MKKVICDLDSTLLDFMDPWFKWLIDERYTNHRYRVEDCLHYQWLHENFGDSVMDFFLQDPVGLYMDIFKPYEGAVNFLGWLHENFEEVEIVTHSNLKETEIAKRAFSAKWFGEDQKIRFFSVLEEKVNYVQDAILIDDYPLHVIKHMGQNKCPGIVFDWEGRNGWSKLRDYTPLLLAERPDLNLYNEATSYTEVKRILRGLF